MVLLLLMVKKCHHHYSKLHQKKHPKKHPNSIVSAYKDNVAFVKGPKVVQFAPKTADKPDFYQEQDFDSVISLKSRNA